jgi:hypothetical protein
VFREYQDAVTIGERIDVAGRKIIHTTHAGTQGLKAATRAEVVLAVALVNCAATDCFKFALRLEREPAPACLRVCRGGQ